MADYNKEPVSEEMDEIIDELNQEIDEGEQTSESAVSELLDDIEEIETEEDRKADETEEEGLAETLREEAAEELPADSDDSDGSVEETIEIENTDAEESAENAEPAEEKEAEEGSGAPELPSIEQLEKELSKERYRTNYGQVLKSTIFYLLVVAAVAVIIAVFIMPVLQISGTSMTDTLDDGDIVVAVSTKKFETGEVIAFYFNNNILIKRVIAKAGDWVDIDEDGNVYVNGQLLDEPYVTEKAFGDCNIKLPYQVPDGRFFIMGDHRETSVDSRNSSIGCVSEEMMVGRLLIRVWPLNKIKIVK